LLKIAVFLLLLFLALLAARWLRALWLSLFAPVRRRQSRGSVEGEMVRDPVCGVWIDRRLALSAGTGAAAVPVCSEACRRVLEKRAAP
jgi:hypothetical protein